MSGRNSPDGEQSFVFLEIEGRSAGQETQPRRETPPLEII